MANKLKKSKVINDSSANGGTMDVVDVKNNAIENLFPHVTEEERTTGLLRYRKFFIKKETGDLVYAKLFLAYLSVGPDYYRIKEGTDTDTQADAVGYTDWAGAGEPVAALTSTSGNTTPFEVTYDNPDGVYIGSKIIVLDRDTGSEKYLNVTNVSWVDNVATITTDEDCGEAHDIKTQGAVEGTVAENFDVDGLTLVISINGGADQIIDLEDDGRTAAQVVDQINAQLVGGTAYVHDTNKVGIETDYYYSDNSVKVQSDSTADTVLGLDNSIHYGTDGTVISTVLELGTIAAAHTAPVKSSALGTIDESGNPIQDDDVGAVVDDWTITFTDDYGAFSCVGTLSGTLPPGDISADYSPANEGGSYFTIPSAFWGGTWVTGDTLTFSTTPSSKGIWIEEIVLALSPAYPNNRVAIALRGGS
ncbi:MAG: hypothetical protein JW984_15280 [Deltaproteobacteria bacterium]|uniref:Uncharacterized protein n=1 Tax=Candidatus Zymogenus saltonus TaxID=2844893 RepID=A0A9D8KJ19_9DELT|nr:hypothetical protein [Candidatus Zymogenus saltonus]